MNAVMLGRYIGAIGLPLLSAVYHWYFFPAAIYDGQYALAFLGNAIAGFILGSVTGFAQQRSPINRSRAAGACLTGASFVLLLFSLSLWFVVTNQDSWHTRLLACLWHMGFCLPLLAWILFLYVLGFLLAGKHHNR
jgi:hypothetical protein